MASRISIKHSCIKSILTGMVLACAGMAAPNHTTAHEQHLAIPYMAPTKAAGLNNAKSFAATPDDLAHKPLPLKPARNIKFDTDEGTWLSLDLSPDGKTIIFDLLGDIYKMPAEGGPATPIVQGLPFDAQPVFSPDGHSIVFISDRLGTDNIWMMAADGRGLRQISFQHENNVTFSSPEWSPDGKSIYASFFRASINGYELWQYSIDGKDSSEPVKLFRASDKQAPDRHVSRLGAMPSKDGHYLYYAVNDSGLNQDKETEWEIRRKDLKTGKVETMVSAPSTPRPDLTAGSYFRPVPSPDGQLLVYGTRYGNGAGLRVLDLANGQDKWLLYPVQRDLLQAAHWRDILPRYTFAPDSKSLLLAIDGKITRLDIETAKRTAIPFKASVDLDLGAPTRVDIPLETGPVRARIIHTPQQSPDGRRLVFSALGHVYIMALDGESEPRRLTRGTTPEFHPSWSSDGKYITYVTWTARDAGHIWMKNADGQGAPKRLTKRRGVYRSPVFAPDGKSVISLRSSHNKRMHTYMEYGPLRESELVQISLLDGTESITLKETMGGKIQFSDDPDKLHLNFPDGVNSIALESAERRQLLQVVGTGWYFVEGLAPVDDLKISPDGRWALAQIAQQLHLVKVPRGDAVTVDLNNAAVEHRKITDVGADFFEWADDGQTITWSVGSTYYRRPLNRIILDPPHAQSRGADAPTEAVDGVEAYRAVVEVPRDVPTGTIVLRGATAITMNGDQIIEHADIVIRNNKITDIGAVGTVDIPPTAEIRNLEDKYVVPGFIDAHNHLADIRRDLLDMNSWGPAANLAYGVTTTFDPSTLSMDMLTYQDLIEAGLMTGSRIFSTGMALFSFNEFQNKHEVEQVLKRYRDHYRLRNIKMYRTGNRRVRQWVVMAAHDMGLLPTTEGALAMKMDLTQVMDGFAGLEHALPVTPLSKDVIQLMAQSGVSYTPTLMITHGGPEGQDYYITKNDPRDGAKLNRFMPRYAIDIKMLQRTWHGKDMYNFPAVAASADKIVEAGGLLGMGAHGEIPGLGLHWEMQAYASGGMTPMHVLRAATMGSAETIGREHELGSLEAGKYADLIILNRNPLETIENTLSIQMVMKNGRLYDGETLDEVWPRQKPASRPWFFDDLPAAARQGQ